MMDNPREPWDGAGPNEFRRLRAEMVRRQLRARDITHERVLVAMGSVPRHRFVVAESLGAAYEDRPLPIGFGQTISQPYIVALMTQLLAPRVGDRVLEIGTGCGYQTAVLAHLGARVETIEIIPELARRAGLTLSALGMDRSVVCHTGDGRSGLPGAAPFAGIIVTAAPDTIAPAWVEQLGEGGRLVVPLGDRDAQWLHCFTKESGTLRDVRGIPVRFVPLVGRAS